MTESRNPSLVASSSAATFDIQKRDALILGKSPRIEPLDASKLGKEAAESAMALRKAATGVSSSEVTEFTATILRHPDLYQRHAALALQLYGGALSPRDRELAVLRIGWLARAPYEWGQHVRIGKQVGITPEEIERITIGSKAPGWSEHDGAILQAVEELLADVTICDQTWATLTRYLDEKQLIELPLLVGQYLGVAFLQNALRMRLMPGNLGLTAR
jgi:4-carboxymuconolactone decarboxylase